MRAIALATAVLIALAMSATPTLAADRTVQTLDENRERASISAWVVQLERAWLGLVLPGTGELVLWTPLIILPAEEETPARAAAEMFEEDGRNSVILEDGAPF